MQTVQLKVGTRVELIPGASTTDDWLRLNGWPAPTDDSELILARYEQTHNKYVRLHCSNAYRTYATFVLKSAIRPYHKYKRNLPSWW